MFFLSLKNACKDYQVFIDNHQVDLSFSGTTANYYCQLSKGIHYLRIKKQNKKIGLRTFFALWVAALVGLYDENNISTYRASNEIDILYKLHIDEIDCRCFFDTYKNNLICTSNYFLETKSIIIDNVTKRRFFLFVKLPIIVLSCAILVPLWFMFLFSVVKSFEFVPFLLLLFLTCLISLFIYAFFRDKKYKW